MDGLLEKMESFLKTTDGGITWIDYSPAGSGNLKSVHFVRGFVNGWAVGDFSIFKIYGLEEKIGYHITVVRFLAGLLSSPILLTKDLGWMVGNFGKIYKTIDSGENWTSY